MKNRQSLVSKRPWFIALVLSGFIAGLLFLISFVRTSDNPYICSSSPGGGPLTRPDNDYSPTQIQVQAILHYATSQVVPQQSFSEIKITFDVLKSCRDDRPKKSTHQYCNFLVFGLGHDSLMWASFNPRGTTLFLEEDPKWVQAVLRDAPSLRAHTVRYRTQMKDADELLFSYRSEPRCWPENAYLRGNEQCRLALENLPEEVYEKEWDLIMIDAPRGYFAEAPGRMGAIFSAAVMARNRKGGGATHVFLHDVDRKVEKVFAEEFLCRKYLVNGAGRLWHFEIPPAVNATTRSAQWC